MRLRRLEFGPTASNAAKRTSCAPRSWPKTVLFASLLLTFGTLFLSVYLEKNIEATGDREHLSNPAGADQLAALRSAGQDPSKLNPDATSFLGTEWLQAVAMLSGLAALLASAWLCAVAVAPQTPSLATQRPHT